MQIWFPSEPVMILLFFVLWFVFQLGAGFICLLLPEQVFQKDTFLTRERGWEKGGDFYQRKFKIRRWKGLLPDGGAWFKQGYSKKHLHNFNSKNLEKYVLESRRAEWTHWLGILPFPVFGLFAPPTVIPLMLVYALAVNMPCIFAQRYNRPRVQHLLERRSHAAAV